MDLEYSNDGNSSDDCQEPECPDIIELEYTVEPTRGFLEDAILNKNTQPMVEGPLKLTVLLITKRELPPNNFELTTYQMVVKDGSGGIFKVVISSRLSHEEPQVNMRPGSTMFIESGGYRFKFLQRKGLYESSCGFLFVEDGYCCYPAPLSGHNADDDISTVTPDIFSLRVSSQTVRYVQEHCIMVFTVQRENGVPFGYLDEMPANFVRRGDFITNERDRGGWERTKNTYQQTYCNCQESPFSFDECIMVTEPMGEGAVEVGLPENLFRCLPKNIRFQYYRCWYKANFFGPAGLDDSCDILPTCFVSAFSNHHDEVRDEVDVSVLKMNA